MTVVTTHISNVHEYGNGVQVDEVDIEPFGLDYHLDERIRELESIGYSVVDQRDISDHPAIKGNRGTTNIRLEVWRRG